jgi:hypothetical protein
MQRRGVYAFAPSLSNRAGNPSAPGAFRRPRPQPVAKRSPRPGSVPRLRCVDPPESKAMIPHLILPFAALAWGLAIATAVLWLPRL